MRVEISPEMFSQEQIDIAVSARMSEEYSGGAQELVKALASISGGKINKAVAETVAMLFDEEDTVKGINVRAAIERDMQRRGEAKKRWIFAKVYVHESCASSGIADETRLVDDMYLFASYVIRYAEEHGMRTGQKTISEYYTRDTMREIAEEIGWESMMDAYESGVPAEDLIA